jgi:hypothetical protein
MILTLSRHTSNDIAALSAQPFHYTLALYNILVKQTDEEGKKQTEQSRSSTGYAVPKLPSSYSVSSPAGNTRVKF